MDCFRHNSLDLYYNARHKYKLYRSNGTRTIANSTIGGTVYPNFVITGNGIDTLTSTGSSKYNDFNLAGFNGTLTNTSISVFGNYTMGASTTATAGANETTFAATSGTKTITTNGKALDFPITFNGVGGTWALQDNLTVGSILTSVKALSVSNGTFDINGKALSTTRLVCGGANIITIKDSSGGTGSINITGFGTSVLNCAGTNNTTLTTLPDFNFSYAGATGTRTINASTTDSTVFSGINFRFTAGTDIISFSANDKMGNVDFTGFSGSTTLGNPVNIYGNLIGSNTMTWNAGATTLTFAATSGTKTITMNGKSLDIPITFNGVGGTWALQDNLTVGSTRTTTLTNGTFDINGKVFSTGLFSSAVANVRTLKDSSGAAGQFVVTGNNGTVWTTAATNNLTYTTIPDINLFYNGSTGTRTIASSQTNGTVYPNFKITGGDTLTSTASNKYGDFNLVYFTGTLTNIAISVFGNYDMGSGTTATAGANATTFAATSGTKKIVTNGKTLDFPLTFNGVGGTWALQDNLTVGATRTTTLTNGTLDMNDMNFSTGLYTMGAGGTLQLKTGTHLVTGTTGTIWTGAGTITPATSTIKTTGLLTAAITFAGGSKAYNNIELANTGDFNIIFSGDNNFYDFNIDYNRTVRFTNSSKTTITNFNADGNSDIPIRLSNTSGTTAFTLQKKDGNKVCEDYLAIYNSAAIPATTWYAGTHSTNGGGNSGWTFADCPGADTCTYSGSGAWYVNLADNCNLTTDTQVDGSIFQTYGTGSLIINAFIRGCASAHLIGNNIYWRGKGFQ